VVAPRLVDIDPRVDDGRLIADLTVPPTFAEATLDSYLPDAGEPTQAAALDRVRRFVDPVAAGSVRPAMPGRPPKRAGGRWFGRRAAAAEGRGLYLDGGFGVGKTHLLAAAARAVRDTGRPVVYGTFVEYTHLVGALGFAGARDALSAMALVAIDEFELDDPGDTMLMSNLLGALADSGVALAATSNTLPGALGDGRFGADDFLREIQGLAARFEVVHIDGPDFRHRDQELSAAVLDDEQLEAWAHEHGAAATVDDFDALLDHLRAVHPSRYGALLDNVAAAGFRGVLPMSDQNAALRFVVLVDRLYDRGIPVAVTGYPVGEVFAAELLAGGYRKKYGRALSRLAALANSG
jgi:cell division protein ZapE